MKRIISLLFILVICQSLCACSQCNCGCCEKIATEAAVSESIPEKNQSREEYLTELLASEKWISTIPNYLVTDGYSRKSFLRTGYGIRSYTQGNNVTDYGDSFLWTLDKDRLLICFEGNNNEDTLWVYDEENGVFIHNHVHETLILFPESRMDEFIKATK